MTIWYVRTFDMRECDDPYAFVVVRVFDAHGQDFLPVIALKTGDTINFLDALPVVGPDALRSVVVDSLVEQERGAVRVTPRTLPAINL